MRRLFSPGLDVDVAGALVGRLDQNLVHQLTTDASWASFRCLAVVGSTVEEFDLLLAARGDHRGDGPRRRRRSAA